MAGFLFRLETVDGAPAEPPTFATAVPNCSLGDVIPLGHRALRTFQNIRAGESPPNY